MSFKLDLKLGRDILTVAATLRITEQKNLFKGACVHHGALEGKIFACPVKAMSSEGTGKKSRKYSGANILQNNTFCTYWDSVCRGDVIDRDMIFHMKFSEAKLGYPIR